MLALQPALTTARMTAFRPGASPPPVRTPIFLMGFDMVNGDDQMARAAPGAGVERHEMSRNVRSFWSIALGGGAVPAVV